MDEYLMVKVILLSPGEIRIVDPCLALESEFT